MFPTGDGRQVRRPCRGSAPPAPVQWAGHRLRRHLDARRLLLLGPARHLVRVHRQRLDRRCGVHVHGARHNGVGIRARGRRRRTRSCRGRVRATTRSCPGADPRLAPAGIGVRRPGDEHQSRSLQVTGLGGASNVPASATAVVHERDGRPTSTAESFLTVYPTGTPKPNASNLNFGAGPDHPEPGHGQARHRRQGRVRERGRVDPRGRRRGRLLRRRHRAPATASPAITPVRLLDSRTPDGGWVGPLAGGRAAGPRGAQAGQRRRRAGRRRPRSWPT